MDWAFDFIILFLLCFQKLKKKQPKEEKAEQARLRDEFRAAFRRNFGLQLENTTFVDEKGNVINVPKKQKKD